MARQVFSQMPSIGSASTKPRLVLVTGVHKIDFAGGVELASPRSLTRTLATAAGVQGLRVPS